MSNDFSEDGSQLLGSVEVAAYSKSIGGAIVAELWMIESEIHEAGKSDRPRELNLFANDGEQWRGNAQAAIMAESFRG